MRSGFGRVHWLRRGIWAVYGIQQGLTYSAITLSVSHSTVQPLPRYLLPYSSRFLTHNLRPGLITRRVIGHSSMTEVWSLTECHPPFFLPTKQLQPLPRYFLRFLAHNPGDRFNNTACNWPQLDVRGLKPYRVSPTRLPSHKAAATTAPLRHTFPDA
jgi:hypothetical protein